MNSKIRFKKLKGFTLVEIAVAMLLSGILLSIAVKVIMVVYGITSMQKRSSDQVNEILLLHTFLDECFTGSTRIVASDSNKVCFNFADNKTAMVHFGSDIIVVEQGDMKDTLRLYGRRLLIKRLELDSTLLEKLTFSVKNGNLDYPFSLIKDYQAGVLFKADRK